MAPVAEMGAANGTKKRRSLRLEMKRVQTEKAEDMPLGYLQMLPSHIMATVFDYMPIEDIGVFTLTSNQARSLFENYMKSKSAKKRFHLNNHHLKVLPETTVNGLMIHFHQFGILMKRATCLYQTKHRLQVVIDEVFSVLNCNHYCHSECTPEECPCLPFFGRFLHAMTMGWDYNEWLVVLNKLQEAYCILGCLQIMFDSNAGTVNRIEMRIRHFYRSVFLTEHHTSYDLSFCLVKILGERSIFQKTRLLFVLYGPCSKSGLKYNEMCEVMPLLSPSDMQAQFSKLAEAISMLHLHNLMDRVTIFAILRCINALPHDWLGINYANLLMSLDEKLLTLFLGYHAQDGCHADVGTWIALMAMITNKCVRNMDWIVDVLQAIFKMLRTSNERFILMKFIQDAFLVEIAEFHDNSAFELDDEINFQLMLSAAIKFNKCFFKKNFHQGLFK